jgi:hypothetical protein
VLLLLLLLLLHEQHPSGLARHTLGTNNLFLHLSCQNALTWLQLP